MIAPLVRSILFTLALGALVGCGEDAPTAGPPPVTGTKKKVEPVAAVVAAVQVDYAYSPVNRRDPFRAPGLEGPKSNIDKPSEATVACLEPLCLLDVDELTVVAVVSGDANPLAMVEDRAGVGHIVRRNTRVGRQGGKVTQILRDCLVVTSFITGGPDGKSQANKQNMCVKTDSRSTQPIDLFQGKEFTQ